MCGYKFAGLVSELRIRITSDIGVKAKNLLTRFDMIEYQADFFKNRLWYRLKNIFSNLDGSEPWLKGMVGLWIGGII